MNPTATRTAGGTIRRSGISRSAVGDSALQSFLNKDEIQGTVLAGNQQRDHVRTVGSRQGNTALPEAGIQTAKRAFVSRPSDLI